MTFGSFGSEWTSGQPLGFATLVAVPLEPAEPFRTVHDFSLTFERKAIVVEGNSFNI
jgi:hypothetical protein